MGEAEGRADGEYPVADLYLVGIADFGDREVVALDFDEGDVGAFIEADDVGVVFLVVVELDAHFFRAFNDVGVGEDIAVAVDDEAGTLSLEDALFVLRLGELASAKGIGNAEEVFKDFRRDAVNGGRGIDAAFHFNAHHGVFGFGNERGEVRCGVGKAQRGGECESQYNQCFIHEYL